MLFAIFLSAAFSSASKGETENARSDFAKIESLLAKADYAQASVFITDLLKSKNLAPDLRAQLYWQKALCHISENQILLAKSSYLKLLTTNPFFEPAQDTSPKVLALYNQVYQKFKEQGGLEQSIQSEFVPIESVIVGEPFSFQVRIEDPLSRKKAARLEFHIRKLGNSEYSSLDFAPLRDTPSVFEATIPPVLTMRIENDTTFEYYADFLSETGSRLGGIGRNTLPLTFTANAKARTSSIESIKETKRNFWGKAIWISAATLAVGGIVAATFAISKPQDGNLRVIVTRE